MVDRHGGAVPATEAELLALPGVGTYTAAAVATFAFGERTTVVDTNVRRVLARVLGGEEYAAASPTRAELVRAAGVVPMDAPMARVWSVAVMELGALVCTARVPRCADCPVAQACAWRLAGHPAYEGPARRGQAWHGTDRQLRGALLAVLRSHDGAVERRLLEAVSDQADQRERCLDSLVADGLVEPVAGERFRLPGVRKAG
jgi:A/G-specific adenine glycosylase